jgi:hypothetical protein
VSASLDPLIETPSVGPLPLLPKLAALNCVEIEDSPIVIDVAEPENVLGTDSPCLVKVSE